ncbi:VOC family protein [Streptomyces sp. LN699]|uniref:VOC family protein n=1 Tax=Streptomyces sp. LN699 TaxID=3112981 RepID=UPI003719A5BD
MLGTDFRPGSPNWLDLGSPDIARDAAFYGALFGWEFVSAGPDAGGYGFFRLDGKTVAAIGALTEEGAKPAWMVHFDTRDIQATVQAIKDGGGTIRMEPTDVMGQGWLAQATDPQGAEFALWQSGRTAGFELGSAPHSLIWVELHVPDPARDIAFYHGVFGWRHAAMKATPEMTYRVLSIADGDQQDGSFGGVAPSQGGGPTGWVPYFNAPDVDGIVAKATENGGTVLMPPAEVPSVGRIAFLTDPAGAMFALLKPDPQM